MGSSEGGAMCMVFAATYPERIAGLVPYGTYAKSAKTPDNPWGTFPSDPEELEYYIEARVRDWGSPLTHSGGRRAWRPSAAT